MVADLVVWSELQWVI